MPTKKKDYTPQQKREMAAAKKYGAKKAMSPNINVRGKKSYFGA